MQFVGALVAPRARAMTKTKSSKKSKSFFSSMDFKEDLDDVYLPPIPKGRPNHLFSGNGSINYRSEIGGNLKLYDF